MTTTAQDLTGTPTMMHCGGRSSDGFFSVVSRFCPRSSLLPPDGHSCKDTLTGDQGLVNDDKLSNECCIWLKLRMQNAPVYCLSLHLQPYKP